LPTTLNEQTFFSPALGRDAKYRILLPEGYAGSSERFHTLFLLHGLYGDRTNWTELTQLSEYARPYKLIIAMPDAGNSWYVNSMANPSDRFEDFVVRDFIADVDSRFSTFPQRGARAIAGLSMGGYGAIKFALKNPRLFSFAASMTGAFSAPLDLAEQMPEFGDDLTRAFGAAGSQCRAENDVFQIAGRALSEQSPYIYLDCGAQDSFLGINRSLAALLDRKKIVHEYHEAPGGHEWEYWDRRIRCVLKVLGERHPEIVSARVPIDPSS